VSIAVLYTAKRGVLAAEHSEWRKMKGLILMALLSQTQVFNVRQDFYPIRLTITNHPEMQRDFEVSWYERWPVNIVDEDTRYEAHLVEELEYRRIRSNLVFQIKFVENGDIPGLSYNRERVKFPEHYLETPVTYQFLEHLESFYFHRFDVEEWEKQNLAALQMWEGWEYLRRAEFLIDSDIIDYEYELYEYEFYQMTDLVWVGDKQVTYESLGYVPSPKPRVPPKPVIKLNPFKFMLEKY
jgi:hypothetical protein